MKQKFRFRRTTLMIGGLSAFLTGLGFARFEIAFHMVWLVPGLLVALATMPRGKLGSIVAAVLLGFALGWWRGAAYLTKLKPYERLDNKRVVIQAVVQSDGVYNDKTQLEFDVGSVDVLKPENIQLPGQMKVSGFGENMVYRGDVVQVEAKLFPTRGSRQASLSFADIKLLGRSDNVLDSSRRRFTAGMESVVPEPSASLGMGLLIGQRSGLPDDISKQLAAVGLTHIIAVSGYNLTIIIEAVRRLGKKRSKFQFTALSVALTVLFLLVTGFSASIVRAAIVSMLSLTAWYYGRTFRPLLLILLAAAITSGWYPIYLWSDIGWYLSFLAFFGVLIIAPLLLKRFGRGEPKLVLAVVLESFCAQAMTVPFVMYIFHQFSVIALVSNVLVVPLVPLGMLLSLIAGVAGTIAPTLAGYVSWPATAILTYMLDMVSLLARVPHALVQVGLSLRLMIVAYLTIMALCVVLWRKTSNSGTITEIETENLYME